MPFVFRVGLDTVLVSLLNVTYPVCNIRFKVFLIFSHARDFSEQIMHN